MKHSVMRNFIHKKILFDEFNELKKKSQILCVLYLLDNVMARTDQLINDCIINLLLMHLVEPLPMECSLNVIDLDIYLIANRAFLSDYVL